MKRISALICGITLLISLCACSTDSESVSGNDYINEELCYTFVNENDGYYLVGKVSESDYTYAEALRMDYQTRYENFGTYCGTAQKIEIPETYTGDEGTYPVKAIGACAFLGCSSITEISLPYCLESISQYALSTCNKLKTVKFGKSGTENANLSIAVDAFSQSSKLRTVFFYGSYSVYQEKPVLPEIEKIRDPLTRLTLLVENDYLDAFTNHYNWGGCYGGIVSLDCYNEETGYIINNNQIYGYLGEKAELVLPESAKNIHAYAFYDNDDIKSLTVNSELEGIGQSAFNGCGLLSSVTLSVENGKLSSIGNSAFYGCEKLQTVIIPKTLTIINNYTFARCTGLSIVIIEAESELSNIYSYAFYLCSALNTVSVEGGEADYKQISVDEKGNDNFVNATFTYGLKN